MMDTARPEPTLGNLEATTLAKQYVLFRNTYIVEVNLGMPKGCVIVAEGS